MKEGSGPRRIPPAAVHSIVTSSQSNQFQSARWNPMESDGIRWGWARFKLHSVGFNHSRCLWRIHKYKSMCGPSVGFIGSTKLEQSVSIISPLPICFLGFLSFYLSIYLSIFLSLGLKFLQAPSVLIKLDLTASSMGFEFHDTQRRRPDKSRWIGTMEWTLNQLDRVRIRWNFGGI